MIVINIDDKFGK